MDYSKFMDENFEVKDWVNAAFKSQKEGVSNDQYATTLVMKLQMFIQEVNNVIEESCQQVMQNLPRVARELESVRQEATLLKEQMTMVKHDIQQVEHDTSNSMQMLLKLDNIKSRMKAASEALQEADNWTTLSADVDEVFDSQDISAISAKLVGMNQSLQVLTDVPDYAERCQFLETLKNRLEATLSTQLVAAFNSQSTDLAMQYVKIFTDIERLPQLVKYYHKCQKGTLLNRWRNIQEENPDSSLIEWLNDFYDLLLSTWHSQIKWCSQLFEEPVPIVCELLTETLMSMDPPLSRCIANHLEDIDEPLAVLIQLKQMSERFAKSISGAIENYIASKSLPEAYIESQQKLALAIYTPYKIYVQRYSEYEEALLIKAVEAILLDHEEIAESVHLLGQSVNKVFSAANEARERCLQFTNGCGYVSLLHALKKYFNEYVVQFRRVVTNLGEKCQVDSSTVESEDWTWFQHSLRIIQACGDLIIHTEELDQALVKSFISSVGKFCLPHPSSPIKEPTSPRLEKIQPPFQDFIILLLEQQQDRDALGEMFTGLEEGDTPSLLDDVKSQMCALSQTAHKFAFDIVFSPLKEQMAHIPTMEVWTTSSTGGALTSDLPNFSLSPQEYITKVGQYLLTLPQQLDPFTLQDSPSLTVAIRYGKLPYTIQQDSSEQQLADLWLESVARGTMHTYVEQILRIQELTAVSTRQLTTDIDYLSNVLDDLGLQSSESLQQLVTLLQTPPEQYTEVAEKMPQRLTYAVATMRGINMD